MADHLQKSRGTRQASIFSWSSPSSLFSQPHTFRSHHSPFPSVPSCVFTVALHIHQDCNPRRRLAGRGEMAVFSIAWDVCLEASPLSLSLERQNECKGFSGISPSDHLPLLFAPERLINTGSRPLENQLSRVAGFSLGKSDLASISPRSQATLSHHLPAKNL